MDQNEQNVLEPEAEDSTSSALVVKKNTIIRAGYFMTLNEQRLVVMAAAEAKKAGYTDLPPEQVETVPPIVIHATDFARTFDLDLQNAYSQMREAAQGLLGKHVYFKEDDKSGFDDVGIVWVNRRRFGTKDGVAGAVEIRFNPEIFQHFSSLGGFFSRYHIANVAKLTSRYAVRLYENSVSWASVGESRYIKLDEFRFLLGVDKGKYKTMSNFKARCLTPALEQLKETDLDIELEEKRTGRSITHFKIKVRYRNVQPQADQLPFEGKCMTAMQRKFFSKKLSILPSFVAKIKPPKGGSSGQYQAWIETELGKVERLREWASFLEEVDFSFSSLANVVNTPDAQEPEPEETPPPPEPIEFWTPEKVASLASLLAKDVRVFKTRADGLNAAQFEEFLVEVFQTKEGRVQWWADLRGYLPEGIEP